MVLPKARLTASLAGASSALAGAAAAADPAARANALSARVRVRNCVMALLTRVGRIGGGLSANQSQIAVAGLDEGEQAEGDQAGRGEGQQGVAERHRSQVGQGAAGILRFRA